MIAAYIARNVCCWGELNIYHFRTTAVVVVPVMSCRGTVLPSAGSATY